MYHWFILGWTAFGGPAAHVGMFHKLFVEKLRWCSNLVFTELFMLGQCMPGPTSTQMGFAQGILKKGTCPDCVLICPALGCVPILR